jgi:hypothetical protein
MVFSRNGSRRDDDQAEAVAEAYQQGRQLGCQESQQHTAAACYGYPPALVKSCDDPFDYALGLRNGSVVRFERATPIGRHWVHLDGVTEYHPHDQAQALDYNFERGLDVRVADICWIADAPQGS